MTKFLFLATLFTISINTIYSQEEFETIQLCGSRIQKPVEIVVERKTDKVSFYVKNLSYYKFDVNLEIKNTENLTQAAFSRVYSIGYGKTHLTTLTRKDVEQGFSYDYSYSYKLKESDVQNKNFVYLHPIGIDRYLTSEIQQTGYLNGFNNYNLKTNDTVFAMRKGYVVADNKKLTIESRLYEHSLEVLHDDGTFMVYMYFNKEDESLIKRGQKVYPGQALFVNRSGDKTLNVGHFQIIEGNIVSMEQTFNCCNTRNIIDSCQISYPTEYITREMSKSEIRKYLKGKLF